MATHGAVCHLRAGLCLGTQTSTDGGIGTDEQAVDAQIAVDQGATGDQLLVPFTGEPDAVNFSGTAFGTISSAERD